MATAALRFNVDDCPTLPDNHCSMQRLKDVLQPSYWESLCPGLHCGDQQFVATCNTIILGQQRLADLEQQININGVAQVASEELPWSMKPDQLAAAVVSLMHHGWPPTLLLMYDETWAVIQQASALMRGATGGNACNMDILAWYVDPNRGDVGFSPHRDRQPDDAPATFRPDGTAMYATLWLALTDATPENSCLYVIPRFADPGYYEGDPDDESSPDPLTAALPNKESYQHIRALPCTAGSACIFTHRTIHWGSKGRPGYHTPRISMSWGCADDGYEPAYFSREHLPCPPVELRLALAGAQMIIYHERFPAPPKQLRLYYQAFSAQAEKFDSSYRAKVKREFLDASKEATAAPGVPAAAGRSTARRTQTAAVAAAAVAGKTPPASETSPAAAAPAGKGKATAKKAAAATDDGIQMVKSGKGKRAAAARAAEATGRTVASVVAASVEEQRQGSSKKRRKGGLATAAATELVDQLADEQKQDSKSKGKEKTQVTKKQQQQQQQKGKEPAAAEQRHLSESEDEGDGIDWAEVTAAAKEAARKAKAKAKRNGKQGSIRANSDSSDDSDGGLGFADDDDDEGGDVMDMALDAVLDAQLAGEDFHDDFEDD